MATTSSLPMPVCGMAATASLPIISGGSPQCGMQCGTREECNVGRVRNSPGSVGRVRKAMRKAALASLKLPTPVSTACWKPLPKTSELAREVSSELCDAGTLTSEHRRSSLPGKLESKPKWNQWGGQCQPSKPKYDPFAGTSLRRRSSAPCFRPQNGRCSTRHRDAISNAQSLSLAALSAAAAAAAAAAPRDVALLRMVFAEAKSRHCQRLSFQNRVAEQKGKDIQGKGTQQPSLWRLGQASGVLREAMQDVLAAVKVCSAVSTSLQLLQKSVEDRKRHESVRWKWQWAGRACMIGGQQEKKHQAAEEDSSHHQHRHRHKEAHKTEYICAFPNLRYLIDDSSIPDESALVRF